MTEDDVRIIQSNIQMCRESYNLYSNMVDENGYNEDVMGESIAKIVAELEHIQAVCNANIQELRNDTSANGKVLMTLMTCGTECTDIVHKLLSLKDRQKSLFTDISEASKQKVEQFLNDMFTLDWMKKYSAANSVNELAIAGFKHTMFTKSAQAKMLVPYMLSINEFDFMIAAMVNYSKSKDPVMDEDINKAMEEVVDMLRRSFILKEDVRLAKAAFNRHESVFKKFL